MSLWHWIIVIGVFLLLFGGGSRFSNMMGDVAKGLKSFKKGMADDDDAVPPRRLEKDPGVDAAAAERLRSAEAVDRRDP